MEDFPLNEPRLFAHGKGTIGVVRTVAGFYAMRNLCPHMGAPICQGTIVGTFQPSPPDTFDYHPERVAVRCPWHRWEWSLEDGVANGRTTNARLRTYEVEVVDGLVFVRA